MRYRLRFIVGSILSILFSNLGFTAPVIYSSNDQIVNISNEIGICKITTNSKIRIEKLIESKIDTTTQNKTALNTLRQDCCYLFEFEIKNESDAQTLYLIAPKNMQNTLRFYLEDQKNKARLTPIYPTDIYQNLNYEIQLSTKASKKIFLFITNPPLQDYKIELASSEAFFNKYSKIYIWKGIFYGILLFSIFFCLTIFLFLKKATQLGYLIFFAIQILMLVINDLTILGFIYIPDDKLALFSKLCNSIFIFTLTFLYIQKNQIKDRKSKNIIYTYPILRFLTFYFIDIKHYHILLGFDLVFTVYLLINYFYFQKSYFNKNFTWSLCSICIYYLVQIIYFEGFMTMNPQIYILGYSAIILEVTFLTLANTEDIRILKLEKKIKSKHKQILEEMVNDRTQEADVQFKDLVMKGKLLNLLLNKSVSELKEPINQIKTQVSIGLSNPNGPKNHEFETINNTALSLEKLLKDFQVTLNIVSNPINKKTISPDLLHQRVLKELTERRDSSSNLVHFTNNIPELYSDPYLIQCIYNNSLEYFISSHDQNTPINLSINLFETVQKYHFEFECDYLSKLPEFKKSIFEMFFGANTNWDGKTNDFSLYFVRLCVDKLEGSIEIIDLKNGGWQMLVSIPK